MPARLGRAEAPTERTRAWRLQRSGAMRQSSSTAAKGGEGRGLSYCEASIFEPSRTFLSFQISCGANGAGLPCGSGGGSGPIAAPGVTDAVRRTDAGRFSAYAASGFPAARLKPSYNSGRRRPGEPANRKNSAFFAQMRRNPAGVRSRACRFVARYGRARRFDAGCRLQGTGFRRRRPGCAFGLRGLSRPSGLGCGLRTQNTPAQHAARGCR